MLPKKLLLELAVAAKRGLSSYYIQNNGTMVPYINIKDMNDGKINADTVDRVMIKETGALDKSRIEPNDVIISIKGSVFKAAVADESLKGFVISANLIALKLNDNILPEIVAAYLNSPNGQRELRSKSAGAVQKALNLKSLMSVPIPVPPIEKQRVLAEYFSLSEKHNGLLQKEQEIRKKINNMIIQKCMTGE